MAGNGTRSLIGGLTLAVALVLTALPVSPAEAVDSRNFFGKVIAVGTVVEGTDTPGDPVAWSDLDVFSVDASGVRTPIASDVAADGILGVGVFGVTIAFSDALTYELTVTPADAAAGGTTTFRIPGPIGTALSPMVLRLNDPAGEGLKFRTQHWACRYAAEKNCVVSLKTRAKGSGDPWQSVAMPASHTYGTGFPGGLNGDGTYGSWGNYEVLTIGTGNTAEDMFVQFYTRPLDDFNPNPASDPYPYVMIEMYSAASAQRDGWGCHADGHWIAAGLGVGCGGGGPLTTSREYKVTLRTDASMIQPLFVAGNVNDMQATVSGSVAEGSFTMSVAGSPRAWQFIGGPDWREGTDPPDPTNYNNYYDSTNYDWSFAVRDGREEAAANPSVANCIGQGIAATSSNGNGSYMPDWDQDTGTLSFNTDGMHYAPNGIVGVINPSTNVAYARGDEYVGQAEISIPTPLATCMWGMDEAALRSLTGEVLDGNGASKAGAEVAITVDDSYMSVVASGYHYSAADLVVRPRVADTTASGGGESSAGETPVSATVVPATSEVAATPQVAPVERVPLNPPTARPLAPGFVLVSQSQAGATTERVMRNPPSASYALAPAVTASVARPIALTASGLAPGTALAATIKINGRYVTLGTGEVDTAGHLILPVFRATRPGNYRIALINHVTGEVVYVKLRVRSS